MNKKEYWRNWYRLNKQNASKKHNKYQLEWRKTPIGRAYNLISNYYFINGQIGQTNKSPIPLLKSLFISIYISIFSINKFLYTFFIWD